MQLLHGAISRAVVVIARGLHTLLRTYHTAARSGEHQQRLTSGDRTGTWNGPAPHGEQVPPRHVSGGLQLRVFCMGFCLLPAEPHRLPCRRHQVQGQPAPSISHQPDSVPLPSGGRMPLVGLGTYKLGDAAAVRVALAAGYRHIDCASIYGNEDVVGQGLREFIQQAGERAGGRRSGGRRGGSGVAATAAALPYFHPCDLAALSGLAIPGPSRRAVHCEQGVERRAPARGGARLRGAQHRGPGLRPP